MTWYWPAARIAGVVLGTGYTLFFFSETVFWSLWRPDESLVVLAATMLFYAFLGYMLLALITKFRIRDVWALSVAGACFGWVGEGVFAMTLFGAGGMPLPFTIAWTALAWHAPVSVLVGWWLLGRALRAPRAWAALWLSAGLGLFWGVWGYGWRFETPPVIFNEADFLLNAATATALLALAQWAIGAGRPTEFRISRIGIGFVAAATLGFFALLTVPQIPFAPLILLPLLGISWFALRRAAGSVAADAPTILADFAAPLRLRNTAMLTLIPAVATGAYAGLRVLEPDVQPHIVFAVLGSLGGTALFVIGLWNTVRRKVAPSPSADI